MAMAKSNKHVMRTAGESLPELGNAGGTGAAAGTWEEGVGEAGMAGTALPWTAPTGCCWGGGDGFAIAAGGGASRDGSLWRGAAGGGGGMTGTAGGGEGPWQEAARCAPPVRRPPQAV